MADCAKVESCRGSEFFAKTQSGEAASKKNSECLTAAEHLTTHDWHSLRRLHNSYGADYRLARAILQGRPGRGRSGMTVDLSN